jgi:cytochrome c556
MAQVIAPQAQAIWGVTNRATNDVGDALDPSKISAADWAQLGAAGRQLRDQALLLAKDGNVTVAEPGAKIEGASAKQIETYIEANRAGYAAHARTLADAGDAVVKAAETKDVAPLFTVSNNLDLVCESCHVQFWYPPR